MLRVLKVFKVLKVLLVRRVLLVQLVLKVLLAQPVRGIQTRIARILKRELAIT